jgi:hypothetical protein
MQSTRADRGSDPLVGRHSDFRVECVAAGVDIQPAPASLEYSECGTTVEEIGYVPAEEGDGAYRSDLQNALCGACGFDAVGASGCALELGEVVDPSPEDLLLHVRVDDGVEVLSAKE